MGHPVGLVRSGMFSLVPQVRGTRGTKHIQPHRIRGWLRVRGNESDAEVVGAPVFDSFLDLLAVEVLLEGELGEDDDFRIRGEAQAD